MSGTNVRWHHKGGISLGILNFCFFQSELPVLFLHEHLRWQHVHAEIEDNQKNPVKQTKTQTQVRWMLNPPALPPLLSTRLILVIWCRCLQKSVCVWFVCVSVCKREPEGGKAGGSCEKPRQAKQRELRKDRQSPLTSNDKFVYQLIMQKAHRVSLQSFPHELQIRE